MPIFSSAKNLDLRVGTEDQWVPKDRGTVGTEVQRNFGYSGAVGTEEQWVQRDSGYRGAEKHWSQVGQNEYESGNL